MEDFLSKVISIDGTVGSGKSSVGFLFSQKIGYQFVDSGLFYRAVTYLILNSSSNINNSSENVKITQDMKIDFVTENKNVRVMLNDQDVTLDLQTDNINKSVSLVSSQQEVRDEVTLLQHNFARFKKSVIAGQDIGTYVFPKAHIKFFIDAPWEEKAKRRHEQFLKKGENITLEETMQNIKSREEQDRTRVYHPLTIPSDAYIIQNSGKSIEDTVEEMISIFRVSKDFL